MTVKRSRFDEIRRAVCASVRDVYRKDPEIVGTTERVVVGRLMIYLNGHLNDAIKREFSLDQDYERAGPVTKRLDGRGALLGRKIVPDMILHRRLDTGPEGNLLAIEVKTSSSKYAKLHDFAKLSILTGHAKHALAFDKCLRLNGDEPPNQKLQGHVFLPANMHPYKYGLWLLIVPNGTEYWWWMNGSSPQQTNCDSE